MDRYLDVFLFESVFCHISLDSWESFLPGFLESEWSLLQLSV